MTILQRNFSLTVSNHAEGSVAYHHIIMQQLYNVSQAPVGHNTNVICLRYTAESQLHCAVF